MNKNSKLKKVSLILIPSLLLMAGCSPVQTTQVENQLPTIVGTFYPVSEIAREIAQDTINVKTLIPVGAEPHSFEPTAKQIVELSKADALITMEGMFETIENKIIDSNKNIKIIDSSHNLELVKGEEHGHEEEGHEEEGHEEEGHEEEGHEEEGHEEEGHEEEGHEEEMSDFDPHTWLSIHNMQIMTEEITEQLIEMYPEHKEQYEINKVRYLTKLTQLENKFKTGLSTCSKDMILVNHKAFGYLAHEYGFEQVSVSGFSPKSEPSPKTIQNIVDKAKEHDVKIVFSEGQLDKKTINTIADEINGQVLELNPILTTEKNYFELMENNLKNLKLGLECK
jgi:zinc transport system substrate-binding protein